MTLQEFAKKDIPWISNNEVVLSSRIRLARNIKGYNFPKKCSKKDQEEIYNVVFRSALKKYSRSSPVTSAKLLEHTKTDKFLLMERHLISHELTSKERGEPGVIFFEDERASIMVNEEDHIRIQAISQGISFNRIWELASSIENNLESEMDFCFHEKYGYLTSCPTNAGTGLRVSCLLHLTAISYRNEIENLTRWLEKLPVTARGFYGEGTKPIGDIVQISSTTTIGQNETQIRKNFEKIIQTIVNYEKKALETLSPEERISLEDSIWRSYGILKYSKMMNSEEAIFHIMKLRFGILLGLNLNINPRELNQLIFKIQPGHLQTLYNRELSAQNRDILRSELIRKTLFKEGTKNDKVY
ncbi:MAG: ATP--guanido phosphotransferase [Elusimicrobiota bacterium]